MLGAVVQRHRPNLIVEIGAYVGYSSINMACRAGGKAWKGKVVSGYCTVCVCVPAIYFSRF